MNLSRLFSGRARAPEDLDPEVATGNEGAEVTIYATRFCPYCVHARALLKDKGVPFTEIDVGRHPERRAEMIERAGGAYTVPQIFVADRHLGDCDTIVALDRAGRLDALLSP